MFDTEVWRVEIEEGLSAVIVVNKGCPVEVFDDDVAQSFMGVFEDWYQAGAVEA